MATTTRDTTPSFSDWLTTTTRALGYARDSDLARALEIDQSIVSRWRKGSQPSVKHLDRISGLTGTQLVPLLVLAGYLPPTRARHGKTLPPPATDAGERMIRDALLRESERAPFFAYWERRLGEERTRLAKLLLTPPLLAEGDDEALSALLDKAGNSDLSADLVKLYRGLAAAKRNEAERHRNEAERHGDQAEQIRQGLEAVTDWLIAKAKEVAGKLAAAGASDEDVAELVQSATKIAQSWKKEEDGGEEEGQEATDSREP